MYNLFEWMLHKKTPKVSISIDASSPTWSRKKRPLHKSCKPVVLKSEHSDQDNTHEITMGLPDAVTFYYLDNPINFVEVSVNLQTKTSRFSTSNRDGKKIACKEKLGLSVTKCTDSLVLEEFACFLQVLSNDQPIDPDHINEEEEFAYREQAQLTF